MKVCPQQNCEKTKKREKKRETIEENGGNHTMACY